MNCNTPIARKLRRQQTDAERGLWLRLRDRRLNGWKFKRQVPIEKFIVDFCCADGKLVVELDGGQHAAEIQNDAARTDILSSCGYLVLRFWNNDVLTNIDGVLAEILSTLPQKLPPHPIPLPGGEREQF
ncbi:MAG: DUF559 domain-containing protein [Pseudomonadota bacterium]